jgi:hypothetical protein
MLLLRDTVCLPCVCVCVLCVCAPGGERVCVCVRVRVSAIMSWCTWCIISGAGCLYLCLAVSAVVSACPECPGAFLSQRTCGCSPTCTLDQQCIYLTCEEAHWIAPARACVGGGARRVCVRGGTARVCTGGQRLVVLRIYPHVPASLLQARLSTGFMAASEDSAARLQSSCSGGGCERECTTSTHRHALGMTGCIILRHARCGGSFSQYTALLPCALLQLVQLLQARPCRPTFRFRV